MLALHKNSTDIQLIMLKEFVKMDIQVLYVTYVKLIMEK